MSATQWQAYDQDRKAWYYWAPHEDCYVYSDGTRVGRDGNAINRAAGPADGRSVTRYLTLLAVCC